LLFLKDFALFGEVMHEIGNRAVGLRLLSARGHRRRAGAQLYRDSP
jgi:hypothetical protein